MNNVQKIKELLSWMEQHLNETSDFSVEEVRSFFADQFVIKTNSRIVHATPEMYQQYLYQLKNRLKNVKYDIQEVLEAPGAVIMHFVIHLDFNNKKPPKRLQTISIFKLNRDHRIVEWKEVFADEEQKFDYDPT